MRRPRNRGRRFSNYAPEISGKSVSGIRPRGLPWLISFVRMAGVLDIKSSFHRNMRLKVGLLEMIVYSTNERWFRLGWDAHQRIPCVKGAVAKRLRDCAVCSYEFAYFPANTQHLNRDNPSVTASPCQLPLHKGAFWGAPAPQQPTNIATQNDHLPNCRTHGRGAQRM